MKASASLYKYSCSILNYRYIYVYVFTFKLIVEGSCKPLSADSNGKKIYVDINDTTCFITLGN